MSLLFGAIMVFEIQKATIYWTVASHKTSTCFPILLCSQNAYSLLLKMCHLSIVLLTFLQSTCVFVTLLNVVNNSIAIPSYTPSFSLHNQCLHPCLLVCPPINDHKKSCPHLYLCKQTTLLEPQSYMHLKVYIEVLMHQHHKVLIIISFFCSNPPCSQRNGAL